MAELRFEMVNGKVARRPLGEEQDIDQAFRNALDEPGHWVYLDTDTYIRRESVVLAQLVREKIEPLAAWV